MDANEIQVSMQKKKTLNIYFNFLTINGILSKILQLSKQMIVKWGQVRRVNRIRNKIILNIIIFFLNAKVGKEREDEIVGIFGIWSWNGRGNRLVQWSTASDQINTKKTPVHTEKQRRSVKKRFRHAVLHWETYSSADVSAIIYYFKSYFNGCPYLSKSSVYFNQ